MFSAHKQFMILPTDLCQVNHNFLLYFLWKVQILQLLLRQQISHLETSETLKTLPEFSSLVPFH